MYGTLKKRKKKLKNSKIWVFFQAIALFLCILIPSIEIFLDGIIDWADYLFYGIFGLSFIGYIICDDKIIVVY